MEDSELAQLQQEVEERMEIEKTSGYVSYNNYINSLPTGNENVNVNAEQSFQDRIQQKENEMYTEIKNNYSGDENNAFYERINDALPKITEMIQNKATELEKLPIPNEPSFAQRMYSGISKNQNNADKAMIAYNDKVTQINNYISRLNTLQKNINTLLPIYAPQQTAGKRKTRRNKNKKRKPIKKQQKSKRRR